MAMISRLTPVLGMACVLACVLAGCGAGGSSAPAPHAEACRPVTPGERVAIPAGEYLIGGPVRNPEERPERTVSTPGFGIDAHEVTNAQFAAFVEATGYLTIAERRPDPADFPDIDPALLEPGSAVFGVDAGTGYWWRFVPGASWRHPEGPGSDIEGRASYPVVHVAYADARAYADWAGADLPDEDEWEIAARGGGHGTDYAWGEEFRPGGDWRANTWQGVFPVIDRGDDGFAGLSPVACYDANPFGAFDMIGNVWEWTASPFDASGAAGTIRGGSYLCASDFCARFRPAARQPQEWDFSASHIGFRTVVRRPDAAG
ncbi:MAG: SUMF1/EgtB/PvdO family nonheme iron enzyme [Pseudomonadota bacterium]|nr:SUMF1/EgtB/PvdO family nonheme iron enzyme [Pseudomonadota bacterium]